MNESTKAKATETGPRVAWRRRRIRREDIRGILVATLALAVVLGACVPAAGTEEGADGDRVVLINAPTGDAIYVLADHLEEAMRGSSDCCAFAFQFAAPVRHQETHRDMNHDRAPVQAREIARNLGARWPVMVGTGEFEREVEAIGDNLRITRRVSVQIVVLDPDGGEITRLLSSVMTETRTVPQDADLPTERSDPRMIRLALQGAEELAPELVGIMNALATGD